MTMRIALSLTLAAALTGCSAGAQMLGLGKDPPNERNVQVGQSLSVPPDLSLPAPTDGGDFAAPANAGSAALTTPDPSVDGATDPAIAPAPAAPQDVFAQYGISRVKADGTKKTDEELRLELREAKIAEKRRQNPNYGTFKNLGDLFKDG